MLDNKKVHCEDKKQISFQHVQQTKTPPLKEVALTGCKTTECYRTERKETRSKWIQLKRDAG